MEVIGDHDKNSFSEVALREKNRNEIGNKSKQFFQEALLLREKKKKSGSSRGETWNQEIIFFKDVKQRAFMVC